MFFFSPLSLPKVPSPGPGQESEQNGIERILCAQSELLPSSLGPAGLSKNSCSRACRHESTPFPS